MKLKCADCDLVGEYKCENDFICKCGCDDYNYANDEEIEEETEEETEEEASSLDSVVDVFVDQLQKMKSITRLSFNVDRDDVDVEINLTQKESE
jgi:hypothetical protein